MIMLFCIFFFKQKTAYEMRISDWSSDVCSSDLDDHVARFGLAVRRPPPHVRPARDRERLGARAHVERAVGVAAVGEPDRQLRVLPRRIRLLIGERLDREVAGKTRVGGGGDRKSTRLNSSH